MQSFQSASCIFVKQLKFSAISHELGEHIVLEKHENDLKLGNVKLVFLFGGIPHAVYQACNGIYICGKNVYAMHRWAQLTQKLAPLTAIPLIEMIIFANANPMRQIFR